MTRELLLDLFVAAIKRPHRQCINRKLSIGAQCMRYASNQTSPSSRLSKPDPLAGRESPTAKIPLHVGLDRNPENRSALSRIPIPKGERGETFTPSPLARPLGLQNPPKSGENSPIDNRSWQERKQDFADYDKVLQRRKIYLRTFLRPYFQEWRRVDYHKGKSFVSNERLFRRDKALYFPNIWGQTLSKEGDGPDGGRNTTPALLGKLSIIGIQSGQWAEEQVDTFLSKKDNPELSNIMEQSNGRLQRVDINIQSDWARAMLVKLFKGNLRKMIPEERWKRYFLVKLPRDIRRGLTDDVRDAMGLLNAQVGYVYLVDADCKIRWAGSGHAWKGENEGLNAGIKRLLEEGSDLNPSISVSSHKKTAETLFQPKSSAAVLNTA